MDRPNDYMSRLVDHAMDQDYSGFMAPPEPETAPNYGDDGMYLTPYERQMILGAGLDKESQAELFSVGGGM